MSKVFLSLVDKERGKMVGFFSNVRFVTIKHLMYRINMNNATHYAERSVKDDFKIRLCTASPPLSLIFPHFLEGVEKGGDGIGRL